jgi:hypothetical protein
MDYFLKLFHLGFQESLRRMSFFRFIYLRAHLILDVIIGKHAYMLFMRVDIGGMNHWKLVL